MSGPKSGSYVLVDRELMARRELDRARNVARSRLAELQSALEAARAELARTDGLDAALPAPPAWLGEDADTDAYRGLDGEVAGAIGEVRAAMAQAHAARRGRQVRESLGTTDADTRLRTAADALGNSTAPPSPDRATPAAARSVADTTLRLLDRLRDDVPAASREAVDAAVSRLAAGATRDDQDRWITELRHAVDLANRQAERHQRDADRARLLLADLRRVTDDQPGLDAALERVLHADGLLDDDLVEQVRAVVTAADAADDAALVAASIADALGELGYEVEAGFETVLARDGLAHVRVGGADWRDHGVRVRLDPQGRKLGFHVVRAAGSSDAADRDVMLEADWCQDVPDVVAHVAERGIEVALTSRAEPGQLPVLEVPAGVLGEASSPDAAADPPGEDRDAQRRRARRQQRRRGQERSR